MEVSGIFADLDKTLSLYKIDKEVCESIASYAKEGLKLLDKYVKEMYQWMPEVEEFKTLFSRQSTVDRVKKKQIEYWQEFFAAKIDDEYIQSRFHVGLTHAKINLPLSSYTSAVCWGMGWWQEQLAATDKSDNEKMAISKAMNTLILLDAAITCTAYSDATNQLIEEQSQTLMELSTPTIQLWDDVLVLPIVGVLDSQRAQGMMDELLKRVAATSSKVAIVDIVGVPNVDSSVANHLIKIVKATRLLGCSCILSGISPMVAQSLVQVGVELDNVTTTSNLQNAFKVGMELIDIEIKAKR